MNLQDRVLYRDGLILVIDKPAGIPVHAGPSGGPSLEDYFDQLRFGLPRSPALAHRLDRDTTGCLALGRHAKALRKLGKLFSQNRIEKTYWAIVRGAPAEASGTIDAPLKKIRTANSWRMEIAEDGQAAATAWRVLGAGEASSFIEARPATGRTHQIRVHLAAVGCPVLGDPQYGNLSAAERAGPMMLHARALAIPLSQTQGPIRVEAAPPAPMAELLRRINQTTFP